MQRSSGDSRSNSSMDGHTSAQNGTDVQRIMQSLESWKEFIAISWTVLKWEQTYYGGCVAAAVVSLFLVWWYLEISVVTTFAIIMFIVVTADFVIPSFGHKLLLGKEWSEVHQGKYNEACQWMLDCKDKAHSAYEFVKARKSSNAFAYVIAVNGLLFIIGLLGNWFNNTFLFFLIVLFLSLFPGLQQHGIIQSAYSKFFSKAKQAFNSTKSKVKQG